jgi:hypothetical protein
VAISEGLKGRWNAKKAVFWAVPPFERENEKNCLLATQHPRGDMRIWMCHGGEWELPL